MKGLAALMIVATLLVVMGSAVADASDNYFLIMGVSGYDSLLCHGVESIANQKAHDYFTYNGNNGYVKWGDSSNVVLAPNSPLIEDGPIRYQNCSGAEIEVTADTTFYFGATSGGKIEVILNGVSKGYNSGTGSSSRKSFQILAGKYTVQHTGTEENPNRWIVEVNSVIPYVTLDDNISVAIKKGESEIGQTAPVIGDTLTVSCSASDLIYEWFVGGVSQGKATAANTSYTVKAADAGKTITVKAYQTKDENGADYAENTRPVKESTATVAVVRKTPAAINAETAKNNIKIDYQDETTTPGIGYEISTDNTSTTAAESPVSLTSVLDGNGTPTIYVRTAETDDTAAGEWVAVTFNARPEAPNNLGSTSATNGNSADGTITGVDDTMEYSADGTNWTVISSTTITGLNPGTYSVRVKATDSTPHGVAATVTVGSKEIILVENQKPTPKTELTYTGAELTLLNKPTGALPTGAVEIQYAIGKDATTAPTSGWDTSIPTATNAGT